MTMILKIFAAMTEEAYIADANILEVKNIVKRYEHMYTFYTKETDSNYAIDASLGSILIMCMIIGIPSNLLSLVYFSQQARKGSKTVYDVLYTLASTTDTCTLITSFGPVTVLMSHTNRAPGVFSNPALCSSWTVVFYFVTRFSLFLVMMISVCRTIAIRAPFCVINKRAVLFACTSYAAWILVKDVFFISMGAVSVKNYQSDWASCIFMYDKGLGTVYVGFVAIELVVVTLIIVATFLVCFFSLLTTPAHTSTMTARFRGISKAIAIFTSLCLTCSLPVIFLIILTLEGVDIGLNHQVLHYLRFLSYVFLVILNAALNPGVYIMLMPTYRLWVWDHFKIWTGISQKAIEEKNGYRDTKMDDKKNVERCMKTTEN